MRAQVEAKKADVGLVLPAGFDDRGWLLAFGVIAAWAIPVYAVLIRTLSRREA